MLFSVLQDSNIFKYANKIWKLYRSFVQTNTHLTGISSVLLQLLGLRYLIRNITAVRPLVSMVSRPLPVLYLAFPLVNTCRGLAACCGLMLVFTFLPDGLSATM